MSHAALRFSLCACLAWLAVQPAGVRAQDVSARDRQSAGEAYDRGTAAYLAEDFAGAARWFETADRLAPASAALIQATRAHGRAGDERRAATLALRLQSLYPDDAAAARTAARALEAAARFLRVDVTCDTDCTIEVGGAIMGHTSFFLDPGAEHAVTAEFETGRQTQTATGDAGETVALSFTAPPAPEPDPGVGSGSPEPPTEQDSGSSGVPLGVSIAAVVVTAGLGAVLTWSGVDTLDGVPAYEANPTTATLQDGRAREERTNWLIASTAVAGAATVLLLLLTDWGGDDEPTETVETEATLDLDADHAILGVRGRF